MSPSLVLFSPCWARESLLSVQTINQPWAVSSGWLSRSDSSGGGRGVVGVLVESGDISEYISHTIQSEGAEVRKKLQGQVVTWLLWDNYAFIFIPSPVILPLDAQKKCLITLCPYLVYFELNRDTEGDAVLCLFQWDIREVFSWHILIWGMYLCSK